MGREISEDVRQLMEKAQAKRNRKKEYDEGKKKSDPIAVETHIPVVAVEKEDDLLQGGNFHGLVSVTCSFQNLPPINEANRPVANKLHVALSDALLAGFQTTSCKLLENPSVVEFVDAIEAMKECCQPQDTFFLCLVSHGVRIESGPEAGSYIAFRETRVTTEVELELTAIRDKQLAQQLHDIPCRNKIVALEVCQKQSVILPDKGNIRGRVALNFLSSIHDKLAKFKLEELRERQKQQSNESKELLKYTIEMVKSDSQLLNTVLLESCNVLNEESLFNQEHQSNFLSRVNNAMRGGAAIQGRLDRFNNWTEDDLKLPLLYCRDFCRYIIQGTQFDAEYFQNEQKKLDTKEKTKFEADAQEKLLTQTPQVIGLVDNIDFPIGRAPRTSISPQPPVFTQALQHSITISWENPQERRKSVVLGYQVQVIGAGRASSEWLSAGRKMVLSYDSVAYLGTNPPTRLSVRSLPADSSFRFRVRARNAGGWGEYSEPSQVFRTLAVVNSYRFQDGIQAAFGKGIKFVIRQLKRSPDIGLLQRLGIEHLARYVYDVHFDSTRAEEVVKFKAVSVVVHAMKKFDKDNQLQKYGALFYGYLAQYDTTRPSVAPIKTGVKKRLKMVLQSCPRDKTPEIHSIAMWALSMLLKPDSKRVYGRNEAAMKIQGMYKTRKARSAMKHLAALLFEKITDPETGESYYYNLKTGEASWEVLQEDD